MIFTHSHNNVINISSSQKSLRGSHIPEKTNKIPQNLMRFSPLSLERQIFLARLNKCSRRFPKTNVKYNLRRWVGKCTSVFSCSSFPGITYSSVRVLSNLTREKKAEGHCNLIYEKLQCCLTSEVALAASVVPCLIFKTDQLRVITHSSKILKNDKMNIPINKFENLRKLKSNKAKMIVNDKILFSFVLPPYS